jgi:Flp pilus assembly protein TadD/DNA-binding transcriptional MerR regulator
MPNSSMKLYSFSEIVHIIEVDERQLHRFAHKGLIDPKLSNDKTARFKEIDCVRLRTIKQADELGYEPEAIFRLIGKPDEVLAAKDPITTCEAFATTMYKQIYNELNHCEPLEQLNKQCDLRLLIGYIKNLKELRTGEAPNFRKQKAESPSKPSPTVQGVKASTEKPNQAPESAPSPSVRPYSVAKYWEYMKKVEELQREVAADVPPDDGSSQSAPAYSADDDLELFSLPEDLAGETSARPVFDDVPERSEPFQRPVRAFDKRQSWGVWILAGAFLLLIVAGYFIFSSPEKSSKANLPHAGTDLPQTTPQAGEPAVEQQPPTEVVTPNRPDSKTPLAADEQTETPASTADLEVADLSLWHDSLNNIYRADFSIAKSKTAANLQSVSGYAFVYLRFGDKDSDPKSLLLPSGEMQNSKPIQVRRGARFSIKNFKQMRVTSVSDMSPGDIVFSNVLVYSSEGELLVEKAFNVTIQPFFSTSKQPAAAPEERIATATPLTPIEPREPEPPPVVVPQAPPLDVKDTEIAQSASTSNAEMSPPVSTQPDSTTEAPPAATTRPDSGLEEQSLAEARPESGVEHTLEDPGTTRRPLESDQSQAKIQSTGNPDAATWELRSYNAAVQGDFDQAIVNATKAVELDPGRVNPYINRSWAYLEKDMLEAAIKDCKTALLIDPQNAFAYNNQGLVHQRQGKDSMAQEDYSRACDLGLELGCRNLDELTKQSRVAKLIDQSQIAFNSKNWDDVIRITTEVINLDPQNAVAYSNRSAAYAQKDYLNKALKDSNEAIKFNPNFSLAYNNRGYVLELLGNNRQASADYLKSCSLGLDLGCKNFERLNQAQ